MLKNAFQVCVRVAIDLWPPLEAPWRQVVLLALRNLWTPVVAVGLAVVASAVDEEVGGVEGPQSFRADFQCQRCLQRARARPPCPGLIFECVNDTDRRYVWYVANFKNIHHERKNFLSISLEYQQSTNAGISSVLTAWSARAYSYL